MNKVIKHPAAPSTSAPKLNGLGLQTGTVYVVFLTADSTLAAVLAAHDLATALHASIVVLHFRPVPYALPVPEHSRVPDRELEALAAALNTNGIAATLRTYLCRSEREAAALALPTHSLVFIGERLAGWPLTLAAKWRRRLEALGHSVLLINARGRHPTAAPESVETRPVLAEHDQIAEFSRGLTGTSMKERARA